MVLALACPGGRVAVGDQPATPAVRPGLEVLLADSFHLVRGRRVGLVTNPSGIDAASISDVDRLIGAGVHLVALFSPEHGFRGTADPGAVVISSRDSATGLPIYSLYPEPNDSAIRDLDVLLVDLQDAGARYYTYLWTTVGVMRAAARRQIPVVVLDRPNPIGGAVQGNVLDTVFRSAVGYLAVPMRHGMTLGELARLARHDFRLDVDLRIVPMAGWRRAMYFDQTGLPFVPPSPNLRSLEALIHYPGTCLFEGSNLSVGRGTPEAFRQIGAPGLDTGAVLAVLRAAPPPGVRFSGVSFTPRHPGDGKYADTTVTGIRLTVTDRAIYDPILTAGRLWQALTTTVSAAPGAFVPRLLHRQFDRLMGDSASIRGFEAGRSLDSDWRASQDSFRERRRPFLVYPE